MASVTIENLSDDLDPKVTENVETVTFYDPKTGEKREIELGEKNRAALDKAFGPLGKFLAGAREVKAAKAKPVKNDENAKIREWAQKNGHQIGDRGRIKADIVDAYRKAQVALSNPDTDAQASGDVPVTPAAEAAMDDFSNALEDAAPQPNEAPATQAEIMALLDEATGNVDSEPVSK